MNWTSKHPEHPDYTAAITESSPFPGRTFYTYSYSKHGLQQASDWAPTLAAAKRRVSDETWPGWKWTKT